MASPPQTPKQNASNYWKPESPLKPQDKVACAKAWNSFTEVLNNQNTQEEQQEVMDSTLVYLKAYAANNGLTVDVKKALAGVGMEHDDENAEQTDSENEDEGETSDEDGGQEDEATDDSDYDDTAPSKTTSTTTEATGVESYLTKLIIPLSPRFSVDALQQVRDDFVERMQGERVEVQEPNNGPRHMVKMSNAEIALYANIFFVQMWGMPALRRVAAIIRAYNEGSGTFGDGGLATRAKKYGKKKKIPEACRRVVMDLGDCAKYSGKHSVDLNGYYLNVSFYNLYRSYTGLIREIGKGEPTVLKQLEELGVESGRGQTNAARARSFLTASTYSKVDTEKTQAQHKKRIGNNISAAQVLADLYEYHGGKNLAPLLPYNVARQLVDAGMSKTATAVRVYKAVCHEVKADMDLIVAYAGQMIVDPITAGAPGTLSVPVVGQNAALLTRLKLTLSDDDTEMAG